MHIDKGCRHVQPDATEHIERTAVKKKRATASAISAFYNTPWSGRLAHRCAPGCCAPATQGPCGDREASVKKAKTLARQILSPVIVSPAANKYTKVDPCVRQSALIVCFYGLMRKALAKKLKRDEHQLTNPNVHPAQRQANVAPTRLRRGQTLSVMVEADGAIGIPRDTTQYRELGFIKENKVYTFLCHGHAKNLLLVWLVVNVPIMRVHYTLFKHGTWLSHRDPIKGLSVCDFVDKGGRNPFAAVLDAFASILLNPTGQDARQHMHLLMHITGSGPSDLQRMRVLGALQVSVVSAFAKLWRKVVLQFQSYPAALAPAVDPRRTPEERKEALATFLNARPCCLDAGLSRNLRTTFPREEQYIDTKLAEFLHECFNRIVITSTQVELQFSTLTRLTDTHAKRLGLAGLAARQVNSEWTKGVNRWRADTLLESEQPPSHRCRPAWVKTLRRGASNRAFDLHKADVAKELRTDGAFDDPRQVRRALHKGWV